MISNICMVASDQGLPLKRGPIPFGGGGTDAAAFAAAGIKATSIIGMPTGLISKDHLCHTSNDTVEHIEASAVRAVLELAKGYIRHVDNQVRLGCKLRALDQKTFTFAPTSKNRARQGKIGSE